VSHPGNYVLSKSLNLWVVWDNDLYQPSLTLDKAHKKLHHGNYPYFNPAKPASLGFPSLGF